MLRRAALAGVLILIAVTAQAADPRDPLARARLLYNQGQFEAALAAADEARRAPERADSADLIAARCHLEQFRTRNSADDLASARDRLRRLDPARFTASERVEYLVGLGETLYFDEASGAAAVLFESVLTGEASLALDARDRVLDWWASALDRDAKARPEIERQGIYQKVRDQMAQEIARRPTSGTASYWAAAAARGQGDLKAAWDAAMAGWVRAAMTSDQGASLRADLDELVQRALVPERARILAQPPEALNAEWLQFKEKWGK